MKNKTRDYFANTLNNRFNLLEKEEIRSNIILVLDTIVNDITYGHITADVLAKTGVKLYHSSTPHQKNIYLTLISQYCDLQNDLNEITSENNVDAKTKQKNQLLMDNLYEQQDDIYLSILSINSHVPTVPINSKTLIRYDRPIVDVLGECPDPNSEITEERKKWAHVESRIDNLVDKPTQSKKYEINWI